MGVISKGGKGGGGGGGGKGPVVLASTVITIKTQLKLKFVNRSGLSIDH